MGRHVFYTKITPLPSNVPRVLALDLLHSHDEFIRLNPLVTDVKPIDAPRDAEGDEFFSNWYRIHEIMKITGVKIKYDFKGCFHNQSWGMQSHIIGPAGIEMRNKYRIGGNQHGEPREARELGVNTPQDGLYLREDISFTCSALYAGLVKKGMQDASQTMIDRMTRKAELLDEGKLHAMFENGRLKTAKPSDQAPPPTEDGERIVPSPVGSPPGSPPPASASPYSQQSEAFKPGFANYGSLVGRHTSQSARASYMPHSQQQGYMGPDRQRPVSDIPGYQQNQQYGQYGQYQQYQQYHQGPGQYEQQNIISELPGEYYQPQGLQPQPLKPQNAQQSFRSELPGDTTLHPDTQNQRSSPQPNSGYQNQGGNTQPGPRMPSSQGSPSNSARSSSHQVNSSDQTRYNAYQATNPDEQQSSAGARQSSQANIQEWQRSVQNDAPIDENYYHNSRHSHGGSRSYSGGPDYQRMSNLAIQQNASNDRETLPSQRTSKCPVCGNFEGDEMAVSHHVEKAHPE